MESFIVTREFFLWGVCVCYVLSFVSLFGQIPGLYGDSGILPANVVLKTTDLISKLGQNGPISIEIVCLCGILMAFAGVVTSDQRNKVLLGLLWASHLCIMQVGQALAHNIGDCLLMEIGLLAFLMAPMDFCGLIKGRGIKEKIKNSNVFANFILLARWQLFKIHFSPAVYCLFTSSEINPFLNEILPNPLTWFVMQLPDWLTLFIIDQSHLVGLFISFAAIVPCSYLHRIGFIAQVFLSCFKYVVGNTGINPLIELVLAVSLLDDRCLSTNCHRDDDSRVEKNSSGSKNYLAVVVVAILFQILKSHFVMSSDVVLNAISTVSIVSALIIFLCILYHLFKLLKKVENKWAGVTSLIYCCVAIVFLVFSLVPTLNYKSNTLLPIELKNMHLEASKNFKIFNDYFHFEKSSANRYEVILETSDQLDEGWVELNFKFKPSLTNQRPAFALTHTPRLDLQMFYASKNSYTRNHWLLNLAHRILTNQKEVKYLLGSNGHLANAPKYLRGVLYKYEYSSMHKSSSSYSKSDWWVRTKVGDYLPILSKDDPGLQLYLQNVKLTDDGQTTPYLSSLKLFFEDKISGGCQFGIFLFLLAILLTTADPATNLPFGRLFRNSPATHLSNGSTLKGH